MKSIKSKIDNIRKELDAIEAQAANLGSEQPDVQTQIDWLVRGMGYVIRDIQQVENAQGRGKSYAILARTARSQLERLIRELEIWQQTGNKPEF